MTPTPRHPFFRDIMAATENIVGTRVRSEVCAAARKAAEHHPDYTVGAAADILEALYGDGWGIEYRWAAYQSRGTLKAA